MQLNNILVPTLLVVTFLCLALAGKSNPENPERNHLSITSSEAKNDNSDEKEKSKKHGGKKLDKDDRLLKLNIHRHGPCSQQKEGNENIKILFPEDKDAPLMKDPEEVGCYYIKGAVLVLEDITADIQVFVNQTNDPSQRLPNRCKDAQKNGCGGTGSCAYCGKCEDLDPHTDFLERQQVSLMIDGEAPKCGDTLKKGFHNDVALKFCLPTRNEWLTAQGYESSTMAKLLDALDNQNVMLTMKVYMYDIDIAEQQRISLTMIQLAASQKVDPLNYMTSAAYQQLPMTNLLAAARVSLYEREWQRMKLPSAPGQSATPQIRRKSPLSAQSSKPKSSSTLRAMTTSTSSCSVSSTSQKPPSSASSSRAKAMEEKVKK